MWLKVSTAKMAAILSWPQCVKMMASLACWYVKGFRPCPCYVYKSGPWVDWILCNISSCYEYKVVDDTQVSIATEVEKLVCMHFCHMLCEVCTWVCYGNGEYIHTVHSKNYTHILFFVVLYCDLVLMNFTHILQGYLTGIRTILWWWRWVYVPSRNSWYNPNQNKLQKKCVYILWDILQKGERGMLLILTDLVSSVIICPVKCGMVFNLGNE